MAAARIGYWDWVDELMAEIDRVAAPPVALPLAVHAEVGGGVLQSVTVEDANGRPVPHTLTVTDYDDQEDGYR